MKNIEELRIITESTSSFCTWLESIENQSNEDKRFINQIKDRISSNSNEIEILYQEISEEIEKDKIAPLEEKIRSLSQEQITSENSLKKIREKSEIFLEILSDVKTFLNEAKNESDGINEIEILLDKKEDLICELKKKFQNFKDEIDHLKINSIVKEAHRRSPSFSLDTNSSLFLNSSKKDNKLVLIKKHLEKHKNLWKEFLESSGERRNNLSLDVDTRNEEQMKKIYPLIEDALKKNSFADYQALLVEWNNIPNWNDGLRRELSWLQVFIEEYDQINQEEKQRVSYSNSPNSEIKQAITTKLNLNPESTQEQILNSLDIWFATWEESPKEVRKLLVDYAGVLSQQINKLEIMINKTDDEDKRTTLREEQELIKKKLAHVVGVGRSIKTSPNQSHQAHIEVTNN